MRSWVVAIPMWGNRYISLFIKYAAPALLRALRDFDEPVRFVIHTDDPMRASKALPRQMMEMRRIPKKPTYVTLQQSHAEAISVARPGEAVMLLNADLVVSENMFRKCALHLDEGKRAVVVLGIRTDVTREQPPVGADPRDLLNWAWRNRHQIIKDLEWETGTSMLPTNLFFSKDNSVVARGFHLHPVVIAKENDISFISTIDGDLLEHFPRDTIHVVTDPDDVSMIEISPRNRRFPVRAGRRLSPATVAASMRERASELHRWLFTHRIVVCGEEVDCGDNDIVYQTLKIMRPKKVVRKLA